MKLTTEELAQQALGEISALTIAVHAILVLHPKRTEVAARLQEDLEGMLSRMEPRTFPQPFLNGMYSVRDKLLKKPEDPGQAKVR